MKNRELYTIKELKSLKKGDKVFVHYKDDDDVIKSEAAVRLIRFDGNNPGIYFNNGYDFRFESFVVEESEAVQDTGNYIIKIYKPETSNLNSIPSEKEVLQTIFDCVFIRGIDLELYERDFLNPQSGLYDALVKLFENKK